MDSGVIYPDGRIVIDGVAPSATRLLDINDKFITIHRPGGSWSDNGGQHYGGATIETQELADLSRHPQIDGAWKFKLVRLGGRAAVFHPTPKTACATAARQLETHGDDIVARLKSRVAKPNPWKMEQALRMIAGDEPWDNPDQGYVDKARAALGLSGASHQPKSSNGYERALIEALKPFTKLFSRQHQNADQFVPVIAIGDVRITVGDLRRAIELVAPQPRKD